MYFRRSIFNLRFGRRAQRKPKLLTPIHTITKETYA